MERFTIIENFEPKNDPALLAKAQEALPALHREEAWPAFVYRLSPVPGAADEMVGREEATSLPLGPEDHLCFDFGTHRVGYITLKLSFRGSHPDAPAYLRIQMAERRSELDEDADAYHGWISKGWVQQEELHVDRLPAEIRLPRRYAFRYCKVTVLDTSRKFKVIVSGISCEAVSSVDAASVPKADLEDPALNRIDSVGVLTLAECMQEVFEDGPKRDRRLWLGDLRLEALANYATFRDMKLVRRCLYLFAGTRFPDDRVASCLFTDGEATADDTWFSDYGLMYPVTLAEYVAASNDTEALSDLYKTAVFQLDRALSECGKDGIVSKADADAAFIDWNPDLDKTACLMGVLLYSLSYGRVLAAKMRDTKRMHRYEKAQINGRAAARALFWNETDGTVSSGGQDSLAARIWLTLGGVLTEEEAKHALLPMRTGGYPLVSPYMHHYYLEALLAAGEPKAARKHLISYWGGMIDRGADTFWEIWNPEAPDASPYGGTIVNSYCHAWSCTPSYFLRNKLL
jgi:hypothetical protein